MAEDNEKKEGRARREGAKPERAEGTGARRRPRGRRGGRGGRGGRGTKAPTAEGRAKRPEKPEPEKATKKAGSEKGEAEARPRHTRRDGARGRGGEGAKPTARRGTGREGGQRKKAGGGERKWPERKEGGARPARAKSGGALRGERGRGRRDRTPNISVIIPAYNEEKLIGDTLKTVSEFLKSKHLPYEVIVVDDGSTDRTVEIAEGLKGELKAVRVLENKFNRGKGFSVRSGILESKGKYICFSDADLSTPIEEMDSLMKWIDEGYSVAVGSRALEGSRVEVHQPYWREAMGKGFNMLVQLLAVRGIKDTQCGFKLFTAEAARDIFSRQTIDGFGFDVEALFIAKKFGYKIKEVPVRWINRFESRVNPLLHPIQMILEIVKVRLRDMAGRYKKPL